MSKNQKENLKCYYCVSVNIPFYKKESIKTENKVYWKLPYVANIEMSAS